MQGAHHGAAVLAAPLGIGGFDPLATHGMRDFVVAQISRIGDRGLATARNPANGRIVD